MTEYLTEETTMGFIGKAVKLGVLAKLAQVAAREARKPENQKKIQDAVASFQQRRSGKATGPGS